ncbi:RNAse P Rpr2/Rpp21/SNM1 subunit domain-containing protein [Xylaria arbuscula]|nr:RNAse P Rpr2/Rpp21/SNM1 subunit domain-containing protein [Xylaria arbuscula]
MAKTKQSGSIPNKHLYSRLSYLHQAAAVLGSQVGDTSPSKTQSVAPRALGDQKAAPSTHERPAADQLRLNFARHLLTDLRATSLKSQIRLSPAIKHTICKFCDTLLIEGETSTSVVENKSKHGKKPWADVLVVRCNTCRGVKRFPVNSPRQKRRPNRGQIPKDMPENAIKHQKPGTCLGTINHCRHAFGTTQVLKLMSFRTDCCSKDTQKLAHYIDIYINPMGCAISQRESVRL